MYGDFDDVLAGEFPRNNVADFRYVHTDIQCWRATPCRRSAVSRGLPPARRELALAPPRYVFDEPVRCWQLPNVPLGRSKVVFGSKLGLDSNPAVAAFGATLSSENLAAKVGNLPRADYGAGTKS
jgi:hypothetical protein